MKGRGIQFVVDGAPAAKGRARVSRAGHVFTPAKTRKAEEKVARIARASMGPGADLEPRAISISVNFGFPVPASCSKAERARRLASHHTQKPDLDNLVKLVKDACNGVVYVDDSQIIEINTWKGWVDGPGFTSVRIYVAE